MIYPDKKILNLWFLKRSETWTAFQHKILKLIGILSR